MLLVSGALLVVALSVARAFAAPAPIFGLGWLLDYGEYEESVEETPVIKNVIMFNNTGISLMQYPNNGVSVPASNDNRGSPPTATNIPVINNEDNSQNPPTTAPAEP